MSKRSSVGNLPSLQQCVLAAVLGVGIGLTLGKITDHTQPFDSLKANIKHFAGIKSGNIGVAANKVRKDISAVNLKSTDDSKTTPKLSFNKENSFKWALPRLVLPNWHLPKFSLARINFGQMKLAKLALPKFYIPSFNLDLNPKRFGNLTNFEGIGAMANNIFHPSPNVVHARYGFNGLPSFVPSLNQRLNVLVMGVDSNGRNTDRFANTRSDTMMIVSVDPESHHVGVVSIPRDSRVPIAGHGEDKINAAHAFGGNELSIATVQDVFATPIDRYIVVDVQGLKKLLELIGPVDILVEKKMTYTDHSAGLHVELMPGLQQLDAAKSEEYVRFRHDAKGDIGRIERQQWFLRQAYKKLQDPSIIMKLPELCSAATEYVQTNLSIEEMAKLAAFAKDLKPEQIKTAMLPGKSAMIKGGSYWLPDFESSKLVFNRLVGTPLTVSEPQYANQDVAYAANIASNANIDPNRPISLDIRYTRDSEESAMHLATLATAAGFNVKNRMRIDLSDCQHEQIVENTARSTEEVLDKLKAQLPCLSAWPSIIRLDSQSPTDITLVLSPNSFVPAPSSAEVSSSTTDPASH